MLKIRFQRRGKKKKPTYRLVVSESARDTYADSLEILGHVDPVRQPKVIELKADRIKYWIDHGAQPSASVHNLLVREGVISGDKKKSVVLTDKRRAKLEEKQKEKEEAKKAAEEEKKAAEEAAKAEAEAAKVAEEAAAKEDAASAEEQPAEEEKKDDVAEKKNEEEEKSEPAVDEEADKKEDGGESGEAAEEKK